MAAVPNNGRNAGKTRALGFLAMFLLVWGTNNSIPELRIAGLVILCYLVYGGYYIVVFYFLLIMTLYAKLSPYHICS